MRRTWVRGPRPAPRRRPRAPSASRRRLSGLSALDGAAVSLRSRYLPSRMAMNTDRAGIAQQVHSDVGRIRSELESLVRIPSVSHPGHDPEHVKRSAAETKRILEAAGMRTEILQHGDGGPAAAGWI